MQRGLGSRPGQSLRAYALSLGWLALALGVASAAACSGGGSGGSAGADAGPTGPQFGTLPIAGPDVDPPADVTLNPDVVIVHGGLSTLKSVSVDHGVWTLDKSGSGVSDLAVGKVLLLAGTDVARVTAIQDMGDTVNVTVEPVAITDVIQEGSYSWDGQALDASQGIVIQGPEAFELDDDPLDAAPLDSGADPKSISGPHPLDIVMNSNKGSVGVQLGNWKITFTAKQMGGGVLIEVAANVSPGSATGGISTLGTINGGVKVAAQLNSISGSSGSLNISGSKLNKSTFSIPMNGTVTMNFTAATQAGSQYPHAALVKLPLSVQYPFPCWAGIPCYLSVQANLLFQPSLATVNAGFELAAKISIAGTSGIKFENGSASPTSSPTVTGPSSPLTGLTAVPSVGATAMVASIEAPRIGLGVGMLSFLGGAKAGLFVNAINSWGIVVAPTSSAIPCRNLDWKFSANAGGEMAIKFWKSAAVTLEQSATLYQFPTDGGVQPWYTPMVSACKSNH
jgi:hypothetical protein